MKLHKLIIIAAAIAFVAATACKTPAASNATPVTRQYAARHASTPATDDFTAATATLLEGTGDWTDVKMPVTVNMKSPVSIKLSGTAVMTREGGMHISLRFLGFEAATVAINGDSITAAVKLKKIYIAESLSQLLQGFPATTSNLQHLLLGRLFMPGREETEPADFDCESAGDSDLPTAYVLTPRVDLRGAECNFIALAGAEPQLLALSVGVGENRVASVYSDVAMTPAGRVASECQILGEVKGKAIDATITWNTGKAQWNAGANIPVVNHKGYSRINMSTLLKSLGKL